MSTNYTYIIPIEYPFSLTGIFPKLKNNQFKILRFSTSGNSYKDLYFRLIKSASAEISLTFTILELWLF